MNIWPLSCDELLEKFCDDDLRETRKFIWANCSIATFNTSSILSKRCRIVLQLIYLLRILNRLYRQYRWCEKMVGSYIRLILELPQIKHVVIVGNVLASISRRDFYNQLNGKHLCKLIWIPKYWLSANGWKGVLENTTLHEIVEKHHRLYCNSTSTQPPTQ